MIEIIEQKIEMTKIDKVERNEEIIEQKNRYREDRRER